MGQPVSGRARSSSRGRNLSTRNVSDVGEQSAAEAFCVGVGGGELADAARGRCDAVFVGTGRERRKLQRGMTPTDSIPVSRSSDDPPPKGIVATMAVAAAPRQTPSKTFRSAAGADTSKGNSPSRSEPKHKSRGALDEEENRTPSSPKEGRQDMTARSKRDTGSTLRALVQLDLTDLTAVMAWNESIVLEAARRIRNDAERDLKLGVIDAYGQLVSTDVPSDMRGLSKTDV